VAFPATPYNCHLNLHQYTGHYSFAECLEEWLEVDRDSGILKRRTWEAYVGYARNHIIPYLGHIMLSEITAYHIGRYRDVKLQKGQGVDGAPGTVNKHLSLISDVLEDAPSPEKAIISHNPAPSVRRAKGGRNRTKAIVNCLNVSQLNTLLKKLEALYSLRGANNDIKNKLQGRLMSRP
jgi:hypothetical protein